MAAADTVSLADLAGKTITINNQERRHVRTEFGENDQDVQQSWKITISVAGLIAVTQSVYVDNIGKKNKGTRTWSAEPTPPGKPFTWRDGKAIWVYEAGALTMLRTLEEGGNLMKIDITRGTSGFACSRSGGYARENGKGNIKLGSSGAVFSPAEVLSVKRLGTSCRVDG